MSKLIKVSNIESRIYTIRAVQVMLDRDLAALYEVENRALKQAVKRNLARFPSDFMFELNDNEIEALVSQSVIPSKKQLGGAKPFAFTEQGVSALSAVLTGAKAIEINIKIMRAFVKMRQFLAHNADIFQRLDQVEKRQLASELKTDERFERVFRALEDKSIKPKQGIFFDGQVFDAYQFISELIRSAKRSIVLIDNYIDDTVLTLFSKRKKGISVTILTQKVSKHLELDVRKFNGQYPPVGIREFASSHDRFFGYR